MTAIAPYGSARVTPTESRARECWRTDCAGRCRASQQEDAKLCVREQITTRLVHGLRVTPKRHLCRRNVGPRRRHTKDRRVRGAQIYWNAACRIRGWACHALHVQVR